MTSQRLGKTPQRLSRTSQQVGNSLRKRHSCAQQELQKDAKKSATQERYQKFQDLYDMVNKINRIGRLVFENDPVHLALFESKWPTSAKASVAQPV